MNNSQVLKSNQYVFRSKFSYQTPQEYSLLVRQARMNSIQRLEKRNKTPRSSYIKQNLREADYETGKIMNSNHNQYSSNKLHHLEGMRNKLRLRNSSKKTQRSLSLADSNDSNSISSLETKQNKRFLKIQKQIHIHTSYQNEHLMINRLKTENNYLKQSIVQTETEIVKMMGKINSEREIYQSQSNIYKYQIQRLKKKITLNQKYTKPMISNQSENILNCSFEDRINGELLLISQSEKFYP